MKADCFVYVYREGALSAVGHDLKLAATDFSLTVEGEPQMVRAEAGTGSLRVVGVVKNSGVDEREPSLRDRHEIEENIVRQVLEAARYPRITFRSQSVEETAEGFRVTGLLGLHGVERSLTVPVRREAGRAVARFPIHQPDFRIKPFRALLGALRVKPGVVVEVIAPEPFEQEIA